MPPQASKNGKRFAKIFAFAAVLFFIAFILIRFFHLSPLILGGPKSVVHFLTNSGLKSDNNRVNILLLGLGGEGHDGPYLTDSMIIASIDKDGRDVALISIPRDIWVPDIKGKINSVYATGYEKDKTGLKKAESKVQKLFGLPIHYGIRLDFSGFERAIDQVDGLDITVDNSFIDPKFPIDGKENDTCGFQIETKIENGVKNVYFRESTSSAQASASATLLTDDNDPFTCRYETLNFKKGPTHMDGKTALKYVRSRHGTNDEGSDFARSVRQEKVIVAFRQRILSLDTLTNPKKILDLINTFGNSIDSDITGNEVPLLARIFPKVDQNAIRRITLDAANPDSRLEIGDPANYGGQYVLTPKNGNWQDLADYIQGEVFKTVQASTSPSPSPKK